MVIEIKCIYSGNSNSYYSLLARDHNYDHPEYNSYINITTTIRRIIQITLYELNNSK